MTKSGIRLISLLMVVALLTPLCSTALADTFTFRNGIQFGMTKSEVKSREKGKDIKLLKNSYPYALANLLTFGIELDTLEYDGALDGEKVFDYVYNFDENGKLHDIFINYIRRTDSKQESLYSKLRSSLINQYGQPLKTEKGKSSIFKGMAWQNVAFVSSSAKKYSEWWLVNDDLSCVKIDLIMISDDVLLSYTYFSYEEVIEKAGEYQRSH